MKDLPRTIKSIQRRRRWLLTGVWFLATEKVGLWKNRPKVLANSVPKSGTNLLSHCLDMLPGLISTHNPINRPVGVLDLRARLSQVYRGSYIKGHIVYRPAYKALIEELGLKSLLIVRDPRDVAVSLLHWITYKNQRHRLHPYFKHLPNDDTRLMAIIHGVVPEEVGLARGLEPICKYVGDFLPWIESGACQIRFKQLIGPSGGGSQEEQIEEIRKIANFLTLPLSEVEATRIAARVYSQESHTFRKGQIGDWTNHFKPEHIDAFKEVAGNLLIDMKYEENLNW